MSSEASAALGRFFTGGAGPTHTEIGRAIVAAGLGDLDPFDPETRTPNKSDRLLVVFHGSRRRSGASVRLLHEVLAALRVHGSFGEAATPDAKFAASALQAALTHSGWELSADGRLSQLGSVDLETGGRGALDEQLARLRRNLDDPALLLGGAKDLLESIAKFVLEEAGRLPDRRVDFPEAISLSFEQLGMLPATIDQTMTGAVQIRAIYQSARTIANTVNELRNLQGTGHGRTLPTGVSVEAATFVIRQATHVAELMLATHDRQMGRA